MVRFMTTSKRLEKLKAALTLVKIRSELLQNAIDIINPIWEDLDLKFNEEEKQRFLSEFLGKEELDNLCEKIRNSYSLIKKFLYSEARDDYYLIYDMIYGNTVQEIVDIIYKLSVVLEFYQLKAINKSIPKIERKIRELEGDHSFRIGFSANMWKYNNDIEVVSDIGYFAKSDRILSYNQDLSKT